VGPRPHLIIEQPQPHGSVADAKLCGNLAKTYSFCPQPPHFIVIDDAARTPKLFARVSRIAYTRTNALADQIAFKLGDPRRW